MSPSSRPRTRTRSLPRRRNETWTIPVQRARAFGAPWPHRDGGHQHVTDFVRRKRNMEHEVGGVTRVPLQVRPPVDQHAYRTCPTPPRPFGRMQRPEAKVGLDDDEVGPAAQAVGTHIARGLEDRRVSSGDAGFLEHLAVLLAYLDQRHIESGLDCRPWRLHLRLL